MFPTFISILDIQSWWEVPSIAHFCSLFRTAFNLLDFDIEDLEEALLTDGTEETSWLQELIVRLLSGCLPNNEISTFNYQMFLRRLFRQKCQEHDQYNPFNTDIDFQLLPLRTKVDILHALCDFRLDAEDVLDQLKNLEADSLRVEPLGYDNNESAYWYFYGTRLYREDFKKKNNKKKSIWQVICFTEDDWFQLTKKFKKSYSKVERQLHHTLSENFLPELPRLFKEKERLARKRLFDNQPRRTSSRLRKLETEDPQKVEEPKVQPEKEETTKAEEEQRKTDTERRRREAYERRARLKEQEQSEDSQSERSESRYEMAGAKARDKKTKGRQRKLSGGSSSSKDVVALKTSKRNKKNESNSGDSSKAVPKPTTVGRQTNNSLAAATGQIVIQSLANVSKKKLKTSQVFRQTDEDLQTGMHKILDFVKNHEDAWPFADPVDEDYAPNYYSIIKKPMDLQRMEERLDACYYKTYSKFRADFQLIVDNCRQYNGSENEYTEMVDNLLQMFERATEKYLDQITSSEDEIAVEYLDCDTDKAGNKKKKGESIVTAPPSKPTKRKPMLVAQTDKKRERSISEESIRKQSASSDSLENNEDTKSNKSKKHSDKIDKVSKKQAKINKTNKASSKKDKDKEKEKLVETPKKTSKENKIVKTKKIKKDKEKDKEKEKKINPVRSRSVSRSIHSSPPPPSDLSSPPTPDSRFDFSPKRQQSSKKRRSSDFSDEEDIYISGKQKKQCKAAVQEDKNSCQQEKKMKKNISPPVSPKPKDKHNKLRETIEKLKAKSEMSNKGKCEYDFEVDDNPKENKEKNKKDEKRKEKTKERVKHPKKELDLEEGNGTSDTLHLDNKKITKKTSVKNNNSNKNVATIEALTLATEQTLKDINKWLDDTPKFSEFSSASNSPSYGGLDEFDSIAEKPTPPELTKKIEKPPIKKDPFVKDAKRKPFRDPAKFFKRREIQRTIDRLQPGKSKGNLITTVPNVNKTDEMFPLGPLTKIKDTKNSLIVKTDTNAPKLSLGSVLDSFGKHKFVDDQKKEEEKIDIKKLDTTPFKDSNVIEEKDKKDVTKIEIEEIKESKDVVENRDVSSEGGATPNLSAWFKAFGAPKIQPQSQKKTDIKPDGKENEKIEENANKQENARKVTLPDTSPNPDSPIMVPGQPIPRQRKISTGSSMSERSSFSQDMDSPRVGIDERIGAYPAPYPSPLHRSPSGASPVMASPRPDVSPKAAAYPAFNGQIRVGFYQDTVSNKSSPDKSCSPRENPQSPAYAQYSEHVYTPNTTQNATYSYTNSPYYSQTPNYSSTNPTPPYSSEISSHSYYDTTKSLTDQYQAKTAQNYTANSPASNMSSPVSHPQHSPTVVDATFQHQSPLASPVQHLHQQQQQEEHRSQNKSIEKIPGPQSAIFPVKKRAYNEVDSLQINRYDQNELNSRNMQMLDHVMTHKDNKDAPKPYIHQNIPEPKSLTIQTHNPIENYNKGPSSLSPVQQQQTMSSDVNNIRNMNYPSVPVASNPYNTYNNEPNYPINIPTARSLTTSQQDMERKMDMSKYTNMGYNGPDVNFSRNLQQYNRSEMNYTRTTIPSSTSQQPQPQQQTQSTVGNQPNQQTNDMSMRYGNSSVDLQMNYKSIEMNSNPNSSQQAHSNFAQSAHQNTRPPPSTQQQQETAPSGYKPEVSIPRPTYNSPAIDVEQPLGLRGNITNLSHIVDRCCPTDERIMPGLQSSSSSYYSEKGIGSPHIFNKPISTSSSALPMFSQANMAMPSYNQNMQGTAPSMYNRQMTELQSPGILPASEPKANVQIQEKKTKKRKSSKPVVQQAPVETQQSNNQGFQSYAGLKNTSSSIEPSAISLKTSSVVPGSAFNFGPTPSGIGLGSGLYGDKDAYPNFLDEFRTAPNYYMAAAAAAHHRSTPETTEKQTRVAAHQSSTSQSSGYPFLGAPQPRPSYAIGGPFIPPGQAQLMDASSPLYQHYLQAGVLNQSLLGPPGAYPSGYHPALSMRQPYDSMTRPPWL